MCVCVRTRPTTSCEVVLECTCMHALTYNMHTHSEPTVHCSAKENALSDPTSVRVCVCVYNAYSCFEGRECSFIVRWHTVY